MKQKRNSSLVIFLLLLTGACFDESLQLAKQGSVSEVREYIGNGHAIDNPDEKGRTILHNAAYYGRPGIINFLIVEGADTRKKDNEGITALHLVADCFQVNKSRQNEKDCNETAMILLSSYDDVNIKTNQGWLPLHVAAMTGNAFLVDSLLKKKSKINEFTEKGHTALHLAAANGHLETCKILITAGAEKNLVDRAKNSVLHMAAYYGEIEVAKFLVKIGVNTTLQNIDSKTFIELAKDRGKDRFVDALRDSLY